MSGEHNQLKGARPARPHTNRKGGYNAGEHLVLCDRSGRVYDSSKVKKEWTGLIVGADEWEARHPQEFRRGIREDIAVREARPGAPTLNNLTTDIDDIVAVNGAVAASVFTSDPATNARPFVYWTLDLGSSLTLSSVTLSGLSLDAGSPLISRGLSIGYSTDGVIFTEKEPRVGEFGGGVDPSGASYTVHLDVTAQHLRLALIDGAGLGYVGILTQTGLAVVKDV